MTPPFMPFVPPLQAFKSRDLCHWFRQKPFTPWACVAAARTDED
jgi:hypothetical protein